MNGEIGRRVRERRRELGLDAKQLATMAGVAPNTIYRLERGMRLPHVGTLGRIAAALGVTEEGLIRPVNTPAYDRLLIATRKLGHDDIGILATLAERLNR